MKPCFQTLGSRHCRLQFLRRHIRKALSRSCCRSVTSGTKYRWRQESSIELLCWEWNLCPMMHTCNKSITENLWRSNTRQKEKLHKVLRISLLGRRIKPIPTLLPSLRRPSKKSLQDPINPGKDRIWEENPISRAWQKYELLLD